MDQNKINMFLATNAKFFTPAQLTDLRNRITELDDSLLMYTSQLKDPTTALILSIFTGGLGIIASTSEIPVWESASSSPVVAAASGASSTGSSSWTIRATRTTKS